MNRFYLAEQGYAYVNDGQRSVLHETGFQEFLVRDFCFEHQPLQLHLRYRGAIRGAMKLARLARGPLARRSGKLGALMRMDGHALER